MEDPAEFNRILIAEIKEEMAATGLTFEDLFFERLSGSLEAEGEIETADRVPFEGAASGKTLRVDGVGGDPRDAEGVLSVIICEPFPDGEPATINAADAKKTFGHLINFVAAARRTEFRDALHPETPEAGLANMIYEAWPSVSKVKLILVTNALYSARTDAVVAGKIAEIPVTYNIWDLNRLHRIERSASKEKIVVDFANDFGGALPALAASGDDAELPAYLAVIRGTQLAEIYEKWGARLLESNIRSFIQARRKSVNEGIRDTIKTEPEMFFSYNNGLSATADAVVTEATSEGLRILSAHNLQIVNGGQTTASLHAALRAASDNLGKVHVQMKLTVVPADDSERVVPNISKYANSQNKISAADFFSNHPFHMRMEDYSRRVFAPAAEGTNRETRWFYERARGQYLVERAKRSQAEKRRFDMENPKGQFFTKTDLAKIELSFRLKPDTVSKGAQKNFAAFASEIGEAWSASDKKYDETWYRRLVAKVIVFRALEKAVPRQEWYPGGYRANIVTYAIAKLVDDVDQRDMLIDLDQVWARQHVRKELLDALLDAAEVAADVITAPESGIKNITEWAKKQGCWAALRRREIDYGPGLSNCLVEPLDAKIIERDGRRDAALVSGIEAQAKAVELGGPFWGRLRTWTAPNKLFTLKDDGILKACAALPAKIPSEKQCLIAMDVLGRARAAGYVDEDEAPRIRLSGRSRVH